MLVNSNKFIHKKIGDIPKYNNYSDVIKGGNKKKSAINIFITIFCIIFLGFLGKYVIQAGKIVTHAIGQGTVSIVSKSLGKEMTKDEFGNVNVMIIGYGGKNHAGGYLADSIIVASWNPKLGAVTMVSTPRDLFVYNKEEKVWGRINQVFSRGVSSKHEFDTGAKVMSDQLGQIMGIKIPYYVLVDFQGFESVIDTLGGLDINVPEPITDPTYPDWNMGYITFHVNSGINKMDGKTALMYARSRHSTSDFARSLRQQQIVKEIINKLISQGFSPSKIKQLYGNYNSMVKTNINVDEMIGLGQYVNDIKHIFSYGFTTDCSNVAHRFSYPGCFLYAPPKELFDGAAVMLPFGADNLNPTFYDYTQNFVFYVAHNQEYLIENPNIVIQNAIDKQFARQAKMKLDGYANQLAVKLKKYAFNITETKNFPKSLSGTTLFVLGTGEYNNTINILKSFVGIQKIIDINKDTTEIDSGILQNFYIQQASGVDLVLSLGNSHVTALQAKKFNYYK